MTDKQKQALLRYLGYGYYFKPEPDWPGWHRIVMVHGTYSEGHI